MKSQAYFDAVDRQMQWFEKMAPKHGLSVSTLRQVYLDFIRAIEDGELPWPSRRRPDLLERYRRMVESGRLPG
jgi:hypothetical protein